MRMIFYVILVFVLGFGHFSLALLTGYEFTDDVVVEISNEADSFAVLNFLYYEGDNLTVVAEIIDYTNILINGTVDNSTKTGFVKISSSDLSTLEYGAYHLIFRVEGEENETETADLVLFYEEAISGFKVPDVKMLALTEDSTLLHATIQTGSNMDVEWFAYGNESQRKITPGNPQEVMSYHVYQTPDDYNITVVARNALNEAYQTNVAITVVRPIAGFFINVSQVFLPTNVTKCNSTIVYNSTIDYECVAETNDTEGCLVTTNRTEVLCWLIEKVPPEQYGTQLDILISPGDTVNLIVYLDSESRLPMGNLTLVVNFDDGSNESIYLGEDLSILLADGLKLNHSYIEQGDYVLTVTIESELSSQVINYDIYVWEDISNVTLVSNRLARAFEVISFTFDNIPRKGFEFILSYGDSNVKRGFANLFYSDFSMESWSHSYSQDGIYKIQTNASNPFYFSVVTYEIKIQFAIPELKLLPNITDPPTILPLPDGNASFLIRMLYNGPSPTNVTCSYSFEPDTPLYNKSVIIKYTYLTQLHLYETDGLKLVVIFCENDVSNYTLQTQIFIQQVELSNFLVAFKPESGMNKTRKHLPEDGHVTVRDVPIIVRFDISILHCDRFPYSTHLKYDFGDDTTPTIYNRWKTFEHQYASRGEFNVTVTIRNSTSVVTNTLPIKIGVVDFVSNSYLGSIDGTRFTFSMSGVVNGNYLLDVGEGETYDLHVDPSTVHHVYTSYGSFFVRLEAYNTTFKEILYLENYIIADYNMTDLAIDMPDQLDMPPGNVTVRVITNSNFPLVRCVFNMGDLINRRIYTRTANVTLAEPMLFDFTYLTLGNHTVNVECSNFYDTQILKKIVNVWNECFTVNGIFDRQYSNTTGPLRVYTSADFDLASRMAVYCHDQSVIFQWKLYTVVNDTGDYPIVQYFPYTPVGNPRGTIRFAKGTVPANLYRVTLNVTLQNTWVYEPTYLMFIKSPPFACIEGGHERNVQVLLKNITLNALNVSFDPEIGMGGNEKLDFDWSCKRVTATSLDELEQMFYTDPASFEDCSELITGKSRGISELSLLNEFNQGYAITVNVTLEDKVSEFTQLIYGVFGSAPDTIVECSLNCDIKYAVKLKSDWYALCADCGSGEDISYSWFMEIRESNYTWVEIEKFESILETDVHARVLVISPNVLLINKYYRIKVKASGYGRNGTGEARALIFTNTEPYGGKCTPSEVTGFALKTLFGINCVNWKDEGINRDRNKDRDEISNNPLMYEYSMVQPYLNSNGDTVYFKTPLVKSGEMTATELRLPSGSPQFDYLTELYVKVHDRFGDYDEFNMTIKVFPNVSLQPQDEEDLGRTTSLLHEANYTFGITDAGGNNMGLMRIICATVGAFSALNLTIDSASDLSTPDDILQYGDRNESEVQILLKETTTTFINEIASRIPDGISNVELLPSDIILVAKSLEKCLEKSGLVTESNSETVFSSSRTLLKNIRAQTKIKPFPMSELTDIQESTSEIIGLLSKNLDLFQTAGDEDVNTTLTVEQVEADLRDYHAYHPNEHATFMKKGLVYKEVAEKMYEKRRMIRARKKRLANAIMRSAQLLFDALDEAFNITSSTVAYAEPEKTIRKENINFSLEKNNIEHFNNKSIITRDGFTFDFNNETLENVTTTNIQLKVATFKKSPLLHAKGATAIKGSIIKIEALDGDDKLLEFPLTMTISNEGVSYFRNYEPIYVEGGSTSFMYFKCKMTDSNDGLIAYIKPAGIDQDNVDFVELLSFYARSETIPTKFVNDFATVIKSTDWETYGFKVFIPSGVLQKGVVYIAVKPITEEDRSGNVTLLSRRRRSTDNITNVSPDLATANISVVIVTTGCRVYDPIREAWDPNGCTVLPFSTLNETVCRCLPGAGSLFASTFAIPNMIDFHTVWAKFDIRNAAVYGTLIAVVVFYIILACILRRLDNSGSHQCIPTFLSDNDFIDTYFYMITVQTGLRVGSGTSSNISFILGGSDADTGVRNLTDGIIKVFKKNSTSNFILGTSVPLGDLVYLRIWHDNSGDGKLKSWFLHRAVITDLQTNQKYIFLCDRWFAMDLDDGMIERIVPILNSDNSSFETTFSHTTRISITENHLWLSLVLRPPHSAFSRVQRLSCLLTLLLLTMISNAMFFQTESETEVTPDTVRVGSLSFSFKALYISIVGAVITVPPIFLLAFLFRNTRRHLRQVMDKDKKSDKKYNKRRISYDDPEEFSEAEYVDTKMHDNRNLRKRPTNKGEIVYHEYAKFRPWMRNITWMILFTVCAVSSFFLILYSMEWGQTKSEEWLTTFLMSFVESIIIVDPMKVFMIAFLIAMILRRQQDDQEIHVDLESVQQYSRNNAGTRTETFIDFKMAVLSSTESTLLDHVEERKCQRKKEKIAKEAFMRFSLHILFALILFSISYINRDQRMFNIKSHIENQLYTSSKYTLGFSKVKGRELFISWCRNKLFPMLYPTSDYNGQSISIRDKFFFQDLTNAKIGLVRMRQVRVKKDVCYGSLENMDSHFCGRMFDTSNEDKSEFCVGCTKSLTNDAWTYTSAEDIWGISIVGHYNTYSGGGYIQKLDNTKESTLAIFSQLVENSWIDRLTRAVFVEFTIYNANINVLCYSIFLAEFLETGGGSNWVDTQCFKPSFFTDATGLFSILLYVLFVIILIYRTKVTIKNMKNQKCKYWKSFWNVIDCFICVFGYSAIGVWIGKFIYTKKAINLYFNNKDMFINFQHIVIWEYMFNVILGFLVFISMLRIMSALEYNKRMTALADTLYHGGGEICRFSVLLFIGFAGFALLGYLLFGTIVYEYRNIFVTFGSLTNTLIGRNSLDHMVRAAPTFAEFYFFVYAFCIIFTLLTIFAAVLNHSISHVRKEQKLKPESVGIVDIMKMTINDMLSLFGIYINRRNNIDTKIKDRYKEKPVDTATVLTFMRDMLEAVPTNEKKKSEVSDAPSMKTTEGLNINGTATPSGVALEL